MLFNNKLPSDSMINLVIMVDLQEKEKYLLLFWQPQKQWENLIWTKGLQIILKQGYDERWSSSSNSGILLTNLQGRKSRVSYLKGFVRQWCFDYIVQYLKATRNQMEHKI